MQVDSRHRIVTVGAGAQLIDVYAALAAHGLTIPAGSCPSVGIAGHALGGGMGLAGRQFGLTADNLLSAQIVTADGHLRTASGKSNPDLYWALRGGGGGNFGVVTSLRFRAHQVPRTVSSFFVSWPWSHAADALAAWQAWAPHARSQLTSIFHLTGGRGVTAVNVTGQYLGPAADLGCLLAPLTAVGGASVNVANHSYLDAQLSFAGCSTVSLTACHTEGTRPGGTLARASFRGKSDYVGRPLPAAARQILVSQVEARAHIAGSGAVLFDSYRGRDQSREALGDRVRASQRAVLHPVPELQRRRLVARLRPTKMRPYVTGGAYFNYTDPDLKHWQNAYYGSNYRRLLKIRRKYDPHHYFNFPQAIGR
ncbi:MAG: FAD-dependent oxidoreductase [Solirubrobacteraceae bacterium]